MNYEFENRNRIERLSQQLNPLLEVYAEILFSMGVKAEDVHKTIDEVRATRCTTRKLVEDFATLLDDLTRPRT